MYEVTIYTDKKGRSPVRDFVVELSSKNGNS